MKKYKKLVHAGLFTTAVLFATWGLNKFIFLQAGKKDMLYCKNKHQYSSRFGDIFYTKKGHGTPLLLIHDLKCTASAAEWDSIIDSLAENYTVYALDLLGCGRSEKPKMTYTNYIYVQLINNFIKEVIGSRTDIITSGASSNIALMGCYSDSSLYHRIMMINPISLKESAKYPKTNHKTMKYLIELPLIGTTIYNMATSYNSILNVYKKKMLFTDRCMERDVDMMYEASHLGGSASKFFYASERTHYININPVHALQKLDHSICIIGGRDQDDIINTQEAYVYYNPSIEIELIDHCKAYPHIEQPEEVLSLCSIYLS